MNHAKIPQVIADKPVKRKPSQVLTWQYQILSVLVRLATVIAPSKAPKWISALWFKPFASAPKPHVQQWLDTADQHWNLPTVPVWVWGQTGPLVVCVHGWRGSGWQFRRYIEPLVNAGFRVAVFDGPAHGSDQRKHTHLYEFVDVLDEIHRTIAPIEAFIGHSLGSAIIGMAQHKNIPIKQAAFIAGNFDMDFLLDRFCEHLRLSTQFRNRVRKEIENYCDEVIFPGAFNTINTRLIMEQLANTDTGFWQDEDDMEIHMPAIEYLYQGLDTSQFHNAADTGHFTILKDPKVVASVCDFIRQS